LRNLRVKMAIFFSRCRRRLISFFRSLIVTILVLQESLQIASQILNDHFYQSAARRSTRYASAPLIISIDCRALCAKDLKGRKEDGDG
jgi:hypothetical protein